MMIKKYHFYKWIILLFFVNMYGCATTIQSVQPWEKGYLAKQEMLLESDSMDAAFVEHTYSSKEASSGGAGVGGGGCGCN